MKTQAAFFLLLVLILSTLRNAHSQDLDAAEELAIVQTMTKLTEEHVFLGKFAGQWRVNGISQSGPNETAFRGTADIAQIMQNRFIDISFNVESVNGTSEVRITIGYDSRKKEYFLFVIDDIKNYEIHCIGKRKENKLIFEGNEYIAAFKKNIPFIMKFEIERENKIVYKIIYNISKKQQRIIEYNLIKMK